MQTIFEGVFDIDSVVTKGKNHEDDSLVISMTVKMSGQIDRDTVPFLFGVTDGDAAFLPTSKLTPGLWNEKGDPIDDEMSISPSFKLDGCVVTVLEKLIDKPAKNEIIGTFNDCEIKSFSIHPNYGHTFNIKFAFFTTDVDQSKGHDIGQLSVRLKRGVFVKIERKDLFTGGAS